MYGGSALLPHPLLTERIRCRPWRTINVERKLILNNVHNGAIEKGLIQM